MATATVGALRVTLGLDSAAFTEGLSAAQKNLRQAGQRLQSVGTSMAAAGTAMTAAVTGPLLALGAMAVGEASEMRDAVGQVQAALTSMGGAGGRSLDQLKAQADELAGSSLFEDDQILRGVTANLLTFGNVAGAQFDRAQRAAVDLSARLGQDLQASTMMVGKALNDPIRGLAALRRVGIQFTSDQEKQIKAMQAAGNTAGAQAIMLGELERQFGGSAQAARDAANPMERVRLAFAGMAGDIGAILLPMMDKVAAVFEGLASSFGQLSPGMQQFTVVAGLVAAAMGPLVIAAGALVASLGMLLPIIGTIGAPFLIVAAAVAGVAAAFWVFRDDIIPMLQAFGAAVAEHVGPKLAPLWDALKGAVAAVGQVFAAIFGDGSPDSATANMQVFGRIVGQVLGAVVDLITGGLNVITNLFRAFAALLRGDFSTMWNALGSAVLSLTQGILNAFETLFPGVIASVRRLYEGVKDWLQAKLGAIMDWVSDKAKAVGDAFFELYDRVVGHSYVPDMVNEVGQWMEKLDEKMVQPARRATSAAAQAFEELQRRASAAMEALLTPQERLSVQLRRDMEEYRRFLSSGVWTREQFNLFSERRQTENARDLAAADAEGLQGITLSELKNEPTGLRSLQATWDRIQTEIHDSREAFADAFEYGIHAALNGDWRGVLEAIFGDLLSNSLRDLGRSLFDAGGGKSGGFSWASLGSSLMKALPGFRTGGSFEVGGSGGPDSQFVGFRATPGEMVDIRRPGQGMEGAAWAVHVEPSPYFDVQVRKVAGPLAAQAQANAVRTSAEIGRRSITGMQQQHRRLGTT